MNTTHIHRIIFICLFCSIAGLFLPWFDNNLDMTYATGWDIIQNFLPLGLSLFGSLILLCLPSLWLGLTLCLWLTPLLSIYVFLTWPHSPGMTSISLITSFLSAHSGFYVTVNASFIGALLYVYYLSTDK